jgi:DNA-binding Lrp family transcriptional regulator
MSADKESVMSEYFGGHIVTALIGFHVDTRKIDEIARRVSGYPFVEDVFIVTGDYDVLIKAKFPGYSDFKKFVLEELSGLEGVKDSNTMMVVTTYKERGVNFEQREVMADDRCECDA